MLACVATFALEGVSSQEVTVEVDVRTGLASFTLVGLPDRAVRESRERVRAAVLNSRLDFPQKRVTVNLAPAHVRKAGPSFDLAIALGVLAATGQVPGEALARYALCGELSLSGEIKPVRGALAVALGARRAGYRDLLVPEHNAAEAALVDGVEVRGIPTLARLADLLHDSWDPGAARPAHPRPDPDGPAETLDLADVRGQADAKRALEIAAAGGHNLLMVGPPGAGKTMLARRLPGILPAPSFDEALEITQVHSAAGVGSGRLAARTTLSRTASHDLGPGACRRRRPAAPGRDHAGPPGRAVPRRAPGVRPRRGRRAAPAAGGRGRRRSRAASARCGSRPTRPWWPPCNHCPCARPQRDRARAPGSSGPATGAASAARCSIASTWSARWSRCRRWSWSSEREPARALGAGARAGDGCPRAPASAARSATALCNGDMDGRLTRALVPLDAALTARLLAARDRLNLSGRGHDRVLRVARTIADLAGREQVVASDLDEALSYRLDAAELMAA